MDDIIDINKKTLLFEIDKAIQNVEWGSVQIYIQAGVVTQISINQTHKTNLGIKKTPANSSAVTKSSNSKTVSGKMNIKLRA